MKYFNILVLIISCIFLLIVGLSFDREYGFTRYLGFGQRFLDTHPLVSAVSETHPFIRKDSFGYDGGQYAQVAVDPLLRNPETQRALDNPSYRTRRILMPWIAYLLGLGKPALILQVFALINVVCWLSLAWVLLRWVPRTIEGFACWFACMFSMGTLESVRRSLTDMPMTLALALTIVAIQRRAWLASFCSLALGVLTKEAACIGSLAFLDPKTASEPKTMLKRILALSLAALPWILWLIYVNRIFPSHSLVKISFDLPFVSAWQFARISLQHISEGDLDGRYTFFFACLVGFFVQVLVLLSIIRTSCADPWWKIGMGFATLGIFLGLPVWSGYWAFCRVLLPLTIAFNLLLPRNRYFWPIWVMGNLTMLHAIWRFVGTSLLKN